MQNDLHVCIVETANISVQTLNSVAYVADVRDFGVILLSENSVSIAF